MTFTKIIICVVIFKLNITTNLLKFFKTIFMSNIKIIPEY